MAQQATRAGDIFLTPNPRIISTEGVIDTGLNDWHRLVYVVTKVYAPTLMPRKVTYRSHKSYNEQIYLQDLQDAPVHVADIFY